MHSCLYIEMIIDYIIICLPTWKTDLVINTQTGIEPPTFRNEIRVGHLELSWLSALSSPKYYRYLIHLSDSQAHLHIAVQAFLVILFQTVSIDNRVVPFWPFIPKMEVQEKSFLILSKCH